LKNLDQYLLETRTYCKPINV